MAVPRDGDPICPTGAVVLRGRRGVLCRHSPRCTWSGKGHCTWCDKPVPKGRRTLWCSQWCVDAFSATQPERQRDAVEERDAGVCALCELDTARFRLVVRRFKRYLEACHQGAGRWWPFVCDRLGVRGRPTSRAQLHQLLTIRKRWWDMDHTVPISEGGHPYDSRNLRTLCYWCHARVTSEASARRADHRRGLKATCTQQRGLFEDRGSG